MDRFWNCAKIGVRGFYYLGQHRRNMKSSTVKQVQFQNSSLRWGWIAFEHLSAAEAFNKGGKCNQK